MGKYQIVYRSSADTLEQALDELDRLVPKSLENDTPATFSDAYIEADGMTSEGPQMVGVSYTNTRGNIVRSEHGS